MHYEAYVDGSYINGKVGYGAVLLRDAQVVQEFSGAVYEDTESRQVVGELVATMQVLDYCQQQGIEQVRIVYDYKGVEQWATGGWKANKPLTQRYAAFVRECPVRVSWQKVKSHSGNSWNDRADALAKQGAGGATSDASKTAVGQEPLGAIAEAFMAHLAEQGIDAKFDGIKNQQYARLLLLRGNKRLGFFDLYDTKNRPLDPYLHGFEDKRLQEQIQHLWASYKQRL